MFLESSLGKIGGEISYEKILNKRRFFDSRSSGAILIVPQPAAGVVCD